MLMVFGGANIIGNIVGGKLLTRKALHTVMAFPVALGAIYILLFLFGHFSIPMAIITLIWGILAGVGGNINQYWIMSSAPESPDFANGLFISSCNVGTTIGTALGGFFIAGIGTQYVVLVGFLSLVLSMIFIILRFYMDQSNAKQLAS